MVWCGPPEKEDTFQPLPKWNVHVPYLLLDTVNLPTQSLNVPGQLLNLMSGVSQAVPMSSSCVLQSFVLLGRNSVVFKKQSKSSSSNVLIMDTIQRPLCHNTLASSTGVMQGKIWVLWCPVQGQNLVPPSVFTVPFQRQVRRCPSKGPSTTRH